MFRLAAKWANITSLCDEGAKHHCALALHHYGKAITSLFTFERTYSLNKENAKKLITALRKEYKGSLKEMIVAAFGERFADSIFWFFCKKH